MGLSERVLVVPSSEFDRLGRFQGFHADANGYLAALLAPGIGGFRARFEVEDDPSFKQIIPYVVLRAGGRVFTYARGGSGTEARLRQLRSVGLGGHVAEADAEGLATVDAYLAALRRELSEEVAIEGTSRLSTLGLINDDSNPVGRVHLGVVHALDLDRAAVEPLEAAIADPAFASIPQLVADRDRYETWSQIVIDDVLQAHASGEIPG